MGKDIREIIAAVDALTTLSEMHDQPELKQMADRYFHLSDAGTPLVVWFRLYERFPDRDDGAAFWTIVQSRGIGTSHRIFM